jgi:hypothetical protein
MEGTSRIVETGKTPVILETNPDPRGFFYRYLLALTPLFLLAISFVATAFIRGFAGGFTSNLPPSMGSLFPGMGDMVEMAFLLTSPIGIFALFVMIGWIMRFTEMWTGSALALGLSGIGGFLLVTVSPDPSVSPILDLLYGIVYLIPPASVVSMAIVAAWTEKYRRSIRYTITGEGVITRGGVWKQQEHMLPHHQVGRLVLEQDLLGKLLHTGTILVVGTAQWGSEISVRGLGLSGQKDNVNVGLGYAKARQEVSRSPLDCLYGVRDPDRIMALLERLISRPAERGEEQVSYLRKIYEKL